MNEDRPYSPIDCSLHDRLEAAATTRKKVRVSYRVSGTIVETEERILDIITRDGVELVKLEHGEVRLDDLQAVDGIPFNAEK